MTSTATLEQFIEGLAGLLEEGAHIFLDGIPVPATQAESPWASDRRVWLTAYGVEDVAGWVSEASGVYLAESAHLLRQLAALLRDHQVVGGLDLIVRAVIERVGHVNWILDHEILSKQRAARAGLEYAVCLSLYREAIERLGARGPGATSARDRLRAQRELLLQRFAVHQPPEDECDPTSTPTLDVRRWTVEGDRYPDLTVASKIALARGNLNNRIGGVYGGLSGFAHPNFVFGAERREIDEQGRITFSYGRATLEKATRFALYSFGDGVKHYVGYFDTDPDEIVGHLDGIADRLEALCASPENDPD